MKNSPQGSKEYCRQRAQGGPRPGAGKSLLSAKCHHPPRRREHERTHGWQRFWSWAPALPCVDPNPEERALHSGSEDPSTLMSKSHHTRFAPTHNGGRGVVLHGRKGLAWWVFQHSRPPCGGASGTDRVRKPPFLFCPVTSVQEMELLLVDPVYSSNEFHHQDPHTLDVGLGEKK